MPASPVEQRNFYLNLSVLEGQRLAHSAGFSVPSEDVQKSEILDTVQKWILLAGTGTLEAIKECSTWMTDVLEDLNDLSTEEISNTRDIITSFGVGLVSHLIDNEILILNTELLNQGNARSNFADILSLLILVDTEDDEYLEDDEDE